MKCKHKCLLIPYIKVSERKIVIWNKKRHTSIKHRKKIRVVSGEHNKASKGIPPPKKRAFYKYFNEKRSTIEKIGPLINEKHEINDESKMVEIMNSFVKLVFNKKNEDRKFEQLRSNENLAKIAVDKETGKKRPVLF